MVVSIVMFSEMVDSYWREFLNSFMVRFVVLFSWIFGHRGMYSSCCKKTVNNLKSYIFSFKEKGLFRVHSLLLTGFVGSIEGTSKEVHGIV